jgi:hypothetical protein
MSCEYFTCTTRLPDDPLVVSIALSCREHGLIHTFKASDWNADSGTTRQLLSALWREHLEDVASAIQSVAAPGELPTHLL